MKELQPIAFDPVQCRQELDRLQSLLAAKKELSERDDLQPLFKTCPQMAAFIGTIIPGAAPADRIAFEFDVFGDYTADLLIGHSARRVFCAIEFEDARPNSVLHKGGRAAKEWGRRLEHGFGQLIDWFCAFDDHKNSAGFSRHFGHGHVQFHGMLLIGRSADLTANDRVRLGWRSDRVTINTHKIICNTYDDLLALLNEQWETFSLMRNRRESSEE